MTLEVCLHFTPENALPVATLPVDDDDFAVPSFHALLDKRIGRGKRIGKTVSMEIYRVIHTQALGIWTMSILRLHKRGILVHRRVPIQPCDKIILRAANATAGWPLALRLYAVFPLVKNLAEVPHHHWKQRPQR